MVRIYENVHTRRDTVHAIAYSRIRILVGIILINAAAIPVYQPAPQASSSNIGSHAPLAYTFSEDPAPNNLGNEK